MIKIAKFGGSSVASVEQFKKVKAIVEADPDRRFIVSSASGKRFSGDNKITDLLLLVNAHIEYHVDCTSLLADIEARDEADRNRAVAPLQKLPEAHLLDTSALTIEESVKKVLDWYREK